MIKNLPHSFSKLKDVIVSKRKAIPLVSEKIGEICKFDESDWYDMMDVINALLSNVDTKELLRKVGVSSLKSVVKELSKKR